jgi:nitrate/nitrite transporter NarK
MKVNSGAAVKATLAVLIVLFFILSMVMKWEWVWMVYGIVFFATIVCVFWLAIYNSFEREDL